MNRTYKFEVKIKGCTEVFDEQLGEGVIASKEVTYKDVETITLNQLSAILFQAKQEFIAENVEVSVTEPNTDEESS